MKNTITSLCLILITLTKSATAQICNKAFRIIVLGSSTALGGGATPQDSGWAFKYEDYLKAINVGYEVLHMGVAGSTTYIAQPSKYTPPPGRPLPDTNHNITAALALEPDAIIINYPSNDAANGYSLKEQKDNFTRMVQKAEEKNVQVWVATPQPRNNFSSAIVKRQDSLFDWITKRFKEKSIDFYTTLASKNDSIRYKYNSGDGVHFNNKGHNILYERVIAEDIPDTLCTRRQQLLQKHLPGTSLETEKISPGIKKANVIIYPNPVADKFIIKGISIKSSFAILSLQGKMMLQGEYNPNSPIYLNNLAPGVYFLKVNNQTFKFIKE